MNAPIDPRAGLETEGFCVASLLDNFGADDAGNVLPAELPENLMDGSSAIIAFNSPAHPG